MQNVGKRFSGTEYLDSARERIAKPGEGEAVVYIAVEKVRPNPYQPRIVFLDGDLKAMEVSIKEKGVLQPVIVRRITDTDSEFEFELAAGERRLRGAKRAGLTTIPAIIRKYDDATMQSVALIENEQRKELTFVEKMRAYVAMKNLFGSAERVGAEVGKAGRTVELYSQIFKEVESIPEVAKIFINQAASIKLESGQIFAKVAPALRKLQKSNSREYDRVIRKLTENVEGNIKWVERKLSRKADSAKRTSTPSKSCFRENDKEVAFSVTVGKKSGLTEERFTEIKSSLETFIEKTAVLVIKEGGE